MERQRDPNDRKRCLAAALAVAIPILAAGCEETPAHYIDPDRSEAAYAVAPAPAEHRGFTIVVREGDSVSKIAVRCDTTTAEIERLNDLDDGHPIYPGEMLRVPSEPHEEFTDAPRPHYIPHDDMARAMPMPRPAHENPPPPVEVASTRDDQQSSWWSWWSKPAGNSPPDAGPAKFIWPVEGHIIAGFGHGDHGERNDGINIAAQEGTPIRAAAAGTVTYTGNELKGYGNLVLIKHADGYVTAYAHAGTIRVSRGDVVDKGQIIGTTGATGDVDRPQLHFEIRRGVQAVDPERYLVASRAS